MRVRNFKMLVNICIKQRSEHNTEAPRLSTTQRSKPSTRYKGLCQNTLPCQNI